MQSFLRVHEADVKGVISGFDRVRVRGTLRFLANVRGLMVFLQSAAILLKDFAGWTMVGPNKELKRLELRRFWGRCLHDYFYILDPQLGLVNSACRPTCRFPSP